jgi:amidophosphoribosyltransferase
MPSAQELIAHDRTEEEISSLIGADFLVYQDLNDLVDSVKEGNPNIKKFDCAVFDGHYVTGDINQDYLKKIDIERNDSAKNGSNKNELDINQSIGLHNSGIDA